MSTNIENAQMLITSDDLERLKELTGEKYTKEALRVAVEFTLENYKKTQTNMEEW